MNRSRHLKHQQAEIAQWGIETKRHRNCKNTILGGPQDQVLFTEWQSIRQEQLRAIGSEADTTMNLPDFTNQTQNVIELDP